LHLTVLLALIACAALASCTSRSEWSELEVSEAGFAVLMRGEPRYLRQDLETPAGRMTAHLYSSETPDSYFAVGYHDYPLALVVGAKSDEVFNGVRDTWVRRINGRLVMKDNSLKLAGKYPGIEFTAEGRRPRGGKPSAGDADGEGAEPDTFMQARVFLVDQRLYQIIAMGRKSAVSQGVVNRFLNSFRLVTPSEVGTLEIKPSGK
jgi:hypothetical protein